jgi:hypothetical protein
MKNVKAKIARRGVAILSVMVSLALLMAIVTEMGSKEIIRYKLAINDRDALQAEALAESGANFAQLLLMVQEPLQGYLNNFVQMGIDLPAYTVADLFPINSDLLKGIFTQGFVPDFTTDANKKAADADKKIEKKPSEQKEQLIFGDYVAPENGYGGFQGSFFTEIEDEEKKISIKDWPKIDFPKRKLLADQIYRLLTKPENIKIFEEKELFRARVTPEQIIGNIYDYLSEGDLAVDVTASAADWGRLTSGDKKSRYIDSPGILPKKAPMDSISELRLIPGINDTLYQLLAKNLTVYGESGKINILSASDDMLGLVFYMCTKNRESSAWQRAGFEEFIISEWRRKKGEGTAKLTMDGIIAHLEENQLEADKESCEKNVGNESKTFTVKSTGMVGNVTRSLIMRMRSAGGTITVYQYQYL